MPPPLRKTAHVERVKRLSDILAKFFQLEYPGAMRTTKTYRLLEFLLIMLLANALPAWASELHDAAKAGSVEKMQQLLSEGYGANEADEQGNLPLHYAAANGYLAVIQLLTNHGVPLDSTDMRGRTALQIATITGKTDVMIALLSAGADVNAKAKFGGTALHLTTVLRNRDLAKILIQHGADVNALGRHETSHDLDGTPLHWAVKLAETNVIDQLILAGADMKIKNSAGLTPSDAARFYYLRARNPLYFEVSRLLKIRLEQQEKQQQSRTQRTP